jgi:hypothetical protein
MNSTSSRELLNDARAKTEKLIAGLLAQRRDLERFVDRVAPDRFAPGQAALDRAIDASQRVLEGIERALCASGEGK